MDKQEIKKALVKAVHQSPHFEAISKYFRDEVLAQAEMVYEK